MSSRHPTRTKSAVLPSDYTPAPTGTPAAVPAPGRSAHETQQGLTARADDLVSRIAAHDRELLRLGREMRAAKPSSPSEAFYKRRAVQVLRQKRSMERRLQRTMNMAYNLATANDAVHEVSLMADVRQPRSLPREFSQLRDSAAGSVDMKDYAVTDVDEVEGVQEALEEVMGNVKEVNEILSRDFEIDYGAQDEELEAELEAELAAESAEAQGEFENEEAADFSTSVDDIPDVPSEQPGAFVPPPPPPLLRQVKASQRESIVRRAQRRGGQ